MATFAYCLRVSFFSEGEMEIICDCTAELVTTTQRKQLTVYFFSISAIPLPSTN